MNLLYNEVLPITGTIQWWGAFLCLDFLTVLEGEANVIGAVDRGVIHHAVPAFKGELSQCIRHLFKGVQESSRVGSGRLPFLNLGGDFFQSGLDPVEALYQAVVAFLVFGLVQRGAGVLLNGLLYHVGDHLRFFEELGLFRFQLGGVEQERLHLSAVGDDRSLCGQQLVRRRKEVQLDFFIRQVRCLAPAVAIKFVIALPDGLAVLAVGVPYL